MAKRSKRSPKTNPVPRENKSTDTPFLWDQHPNWTAMILLAAVLLVFFQPVMLSNKTFQPPDRMTTLSYQTFTQDAMKEGTYPLWNPYIFGGMPSFASLSSAPYIDVTNDVVEGLLWLIRRVVPLSDFTRLYINYILLGGMLFLLMRIRRVSAAASFFTAIAVVLLPLTVSYTVFGHNTKLASALFIPLIFVSVEQFLDRRNLLFFCVTGLAIGLQLLRAHLQICFYTYLMVGIYVIFWMAGQIRHKKSIGRMLGSLGLLAGAAVMGLLVSSVLNFSLWEYSHYSIRGGGTSGGLDFGYATNWSFPPGDMVTFLIPSFMGFGGQTYWGQIYFTDYPQYFGIIVLLLAGLAIVLKRDRTVWFFTILAAVTLIISFGKHLPLLYSPLFKLLPLFNKFRAPKMIHILFNISMVVLAGLGLDTLIKMSKEELSARSRSIRNYLLTFGGVILLLMLILVIGKGAYLGWASDSLQSKYGQSNPAAFSQLAGMALGMAKGDAVKALFLFLLSGGAVWLAVRKKMGMKMLSFYLCLLLVIDLWIVDKKFMEAKPKMAESTYYQETPEVTFLKKQAGPFRIMTAFDAYQRPANWYMYHKLQTTDGYSAAKLKIYQDFLEAFQMPQMYGNKYLKQADGQTVLRTVDEVDPREKQVQDTYLKMLNVKYLICRAQLPDTSLQLVYPPIQRGGNAVFMFKDALPHVFFPEEIVTVKDPSTILPMLTRPGFDPARTAILEEDAAFEIQPSGENEAVILHYDLHHMTIQADVKMHSLMVVSEIYYPAGWKAYVDGVETHIHKTDYILRSVFLKPGQHTVEFVFNPPVFKIGLMVSVAIFSLLIAGIMVGWRREKTGKSHDSNAESE